MICTGIFANEKGLIYGQTETFYAHMLGLLIVGVYTFVGSYILFKLTNFIKPLRVTEEAEDMGLDISQHGESYVPKKAA
jgi:Amt family ammonium transporter